MGDKKAFALRINSDMLKELEAWAADEFRSTNGQIEYILHEALRTRKKMRRKTNDTNKSSDD
ncbi:hypothetical protein [Olivibacter jilunii]|uniref:Arc family DNA binding domain-containing protein n=1 Tax=Sphingobacterium sp. (strain 21) TaxID=743722 RepID=F4CEC9_SPHS2|nr:hypothetical protein [Olivibacter jilunii]